MKRSTLCMSFVAVAGLVLALAPAAQADDTNDFSRNPYIASFWVINAFDGGGDNVATWNSGDEDLDLSSAGTGFCAMRQSGALRGPTNTVSLEIKQNRPTYDVTFGAAHESIVGIMISSTPAPTKNDTNPRYTFWYRGRVDNRDFRVYRDGGTWLDTTYAAERNWGIAGPIVLTIKRNGANYEFWINNSNPTTSPVYTGSYYTSAQHDSMVYCHILWGADAAAGAMAVTVDNFAPSYVLPASVAGTVVTIR